MRITKPLLTMAFAFTLLTPLHANAGGAEMSRDFRVGSCWYHEAAQGKCSLERHSSPAYIHGKEGVKAKQDIHHYEQITRDRN